MDGEQNGTAKPKERLIKMKKYYIVSKSESGQGFAMHTITAKPWGAGHLRISGATPRCLGFRATIQRSRVSDTEEEALERYKNQITEMLDRKREEVKVAMATYTSVMSLTVQDFRNGG